MDDSYRVEFEDEPYPRDLAFLEDHMAQAAVEAAGVGHEKESAVLIHKDGELVAGASGAMWGGGCQLHVVWVDETLRNVGIGRALMAEVEHEALLGGAGLSWA